jgi:hypothetical protein
MKTITLGESFIEYSIDENTEEMIIENIKSYNKGDGTKLVNMVLDIYNSEYSDYELTLYAYPQDDTITLDNLVKFWEKMGFEKETEQGGEGYFMKY